MDYQESMGGGMGGGPDSPSAGGVGTASQIKLASAGIHVLAETGGGILRFLGFDVLTALMKTLRLRRKKYAAGQSVCRQGDQCAAMYLVISGDVRIYRTHVVAGGALSLEQKNTNQSQPGEGADDTPSASVSTPPSRLGGIFRRAAKKAGNVGLMRRLLRPSILPTRKLLLESASNTDDDSDNMVGTVEVGECYGVWSLLATRTVHKPPQNGETKVAGSPNMPDRETQKRTHYRIRSATGSVVTRPAAGSVDGGKLVDTRVHSSTLQAETESIVAAIHEEDLFNILGEEKLRELQRRSLSVSALFVHASYMMRGASAGGAEGVEGVEGSCPGRFNEELQASRFRGTVFSGMDVDAVHTCTRYMVFGRTLWRRSVFIKAGSISDTIYFIVSGRVEGIGQRGKTPTKPKVGTSSSFVASRGQGTQGTHSPKSSPRSSSTAMRAAMTAAAAVGGGSFDDVVVAVGPPVGDEEKRDGQGQGGGEEKAAEVEGRPPPLLLPDPPLQCPEEEGILTSRSEASFVDASESSMTSDLGGSNEDREGGDGGEEGAIAMVSVAIAEATFKAGEDEGGDEREDEDDVDKCCMSSRSLGSKSASPASPASTASPASSVSPVVPVVPVLPDVAPVLRGGGDPKDASPPGGGNAAVDAGDGTDELESGGAVEQGKVKEDSAPVTPVQRVKKVTSNSGHRQGTQIMEEGSILGFEGVLEGAPSPLLFRTTHADTMCATLSKDMLRAMCVQEPQVFEAVVKVCSLVSTLHCSLLTSTSSSHLNSPGLYRLPIGTHIYDIVGDISILFPSTPP